MLGRAVYAEFARDCKVRRPRPASEKLVNMKLHARGFRHMPHWRDALADYAREFKAALPKT